VIYPAVNTSRVSTVNTVGGIEEGLNPKSRANAGAPNLHLNISQELISSFNERMHKEPEMRWSHGTSE
jgi:hypothetical protein